MTITLMEKECSELWAEAEINSQQNLEFDEFIYQVPRQLGTGYARSMEVHPHLWLSIFDYEYHDNIQVKTLDYNHPLEFAVYFSGIQTDEYGGLLDKKHTLISGSGVQRGMIFECHSSQRFVGVGINMQPELLRTFFPTKDGELIPQLSLLAKGNDLQTLLYPQITPVIKGVVEQIINCSYTGVMKQMFLQVKVLEMIALQLAPIITDLGGVQLQPRFRAGTVEKIYQAREILLSRLENPPSLLKLAQMVGVSDRTLQRGFQQLFGNTVFGYLTDRRMERAERWLREGDHTVLEVSIMTGYSNPTHFSAAFKRKFGISPSQCLLGKKSV
ncbi:helix-turn-helix transcriptional regulator [Iningainema tapete]|uniref:Helix-turn-helix transcriptional regulator n=1 Tax=Iningainema tapete BLCC-T55 TaxID=2748662 RepID=A0A8J6XEP3_9CYAN|nr:AraC family transcriptional regulator [Iningainema tapete]MBD2774189.1 helix-turn-helix transcriptional regulator [Iningainema tapete BLCC-T55]